MSKEIWVFSNFKDQNDFCLLGKACELARAHGGQAAAVKQNAFSQSDILFHYGADLVYDINAGGSETIQALALSALCERYNPEILLFNTSIENSVIAARTAALLCTGLTADCTGLAIDQDFLLRQTRPAYGGGLIADIYCKNRRPQMATVQSGIFPEPTIDPNRSGIQISFSPQELPCDTAQLISCEQISMKKNLRDGRIIVAGGKGIGSKDGFYMLETLANRIGGVVGATRSAIDSGFAGYECQIGQTGLSISPDLYLAFGISGAPQHIAGIQSAAKIIAVNNDPKAPIFDYSDLAIVSDWKVVVEGLLSSL